MVCSEKSWVLVRLFRLWSIHSSLIQLYHGARSHHPQFSIVNSFPGIRVLAIFQESNSGTGIRSLSGPLANGYARFIKLKYGSIRLLWCWLRQSISAKWDSNSLGLVPLMRLKLSWNASKNGDCKDYAGNKLKISMKYMTFPSFWTLKTSCKLLWGENAYFLYIF